jgi:hypothetical protein
MEKLKEKKRNGEGERESVMENGNINGKGENRKWRKYKRERNGKW